MASSELSLKELLSDQIHRQWTDWMVYLFSKTIVNEDGSRTIPAESVERWMQQLATDYRNLTEKEKDSDRDQADKILTLLALNKD